MRCNCSCHYNLNPNEDNTQADREVTRVAGRKTKFTSKLASEILEAYYLALGYHHDSRGHGLLSPSEQTKIVFKARNIQIFTGGRGRWRKSKSMPMIRAAENVVAKARDRLGIEIGGKKASTIITERRSKKKAKQEAREREINIRKLAVKAAILEATQQMSPEERRETFKNREFASFLEPFVEAHKSNLETLDDLQSFKEHLDNAFSTETPPLFINDSLWLSEYHWEEGGFEIKIRSQFPDGIEIHIGGVVVPVDPFRMRMAIYQPGIQQEGYISGGIQYSPELHPFLLLITSVEKQKGVGTKMLRLFCKLVKSYGFDDFAAVGVGEEGALFFNELERRGDISIRLRNNSWLITCE